MLWTPLLQGADDRWLWTAESFLPSSEIACLVLYTFYIKKWTLSVSDVQQGACKNLKALTVQHIAQYATACSGCTACLIIFYEILSLISYWFHAIQIEHDR